jgi:hypothetical protein
MALKRLQKGGHLQLHHFVGSFVWFSSWLARSPPPEFRYKMKDIILLYGGHGYTGKEVKAHTAQIAPLSIYMCAT